MAREIRIDFNALPPVVRERLVDSMGPQPALAPLLANRGTSLGSLFWRFGFGLFALFSLLPLFLLRPLSSDEEFLQPSWTVPLYAGMVFFFVAAGLTVAYRRARHRALPFQPGLYVFASCFVDARSRHLRIIPLSELSSIHELHQYANLSYSHTSLTLVFREARGGAFDVMSKQEAEARKQALLVARAEYAEAVEQQLTPLLRRCDPFFEVHAKGGFEALQRKPLGGLDAGPWARDLPWVLEMRWPLAMAVSLVVGPGLWFAHNFLKDHAAFARAQAHGGGSAYFQYTRMGQRHVAEAKRLGEQADYKECERKEAEFCWQGYLSRWTESPRVREVREERLPRAALKEAGGTILGLRRFLEKYPGSTVDAEAKAQLHAMLNGPGGPGTAKAQEEERVDSLLQQVIQSASPSPR